MTRPRDRLGRPLSDGASDVERAPEVPSITGLTDARVWQVAWSCLQDGLPFHAHEVCEERWRTCAPADRALWRALAQWGGAETHAARGNAEGARRLAERALEGLADRRDEDLPLDVVRERCRSLL
jgi:hypothetical protein